MLLDREWVGLGGGDTRAVMMLREFMLNSETNPWDIGGGFGKRVGRSAVREDGEMEDAKDEARPGEERQETAQKRERRKIPGRRSRPLAASTLVAFRALGRCQWPCSALQGG